MADPSTIARGSSLAYCFIHRGERPAMSPAIAGGKRPPFLQAAGDMLFFKATNPSFPCWEQNPSLRFHRVAIKIFSPRKLRKSFSVYSPPAAGSATCSCTATAEQRALGSPSFCTEPAGRAKRVGQLPENQSCVLHPYLSAYKRLYFKGTGTE